MEKDTTGKRQPDNEQSDDKSSLAKTGHNTDSGNIAGNDEIQALMLRQAIDQVSDWVVITDRAGRIVYANHTVAEMSGYSAAEVIGKNPSLWNSGQHPKSYFEKMWRTILADRVFRDILVNKNSAGELFYLDETISPVKDGEGRITHFVSSGKNITEFREMAEKLSQMVYYDRLTGLPSRTLFEEKLDQKFAFMGKDERIAVLVLDISRLAYINDQHGEQIGDIVLQEVGERITRSLSLLENVGRIGEDEFGILAQDFGQNEELMLMAERIIQNVAAPVIMPQVSVPVSVNLGIAVAPDDGTTAPQLLSRATLALSHIKRLGRNQYRFYTQKMNSAITDFMNLEKHLHAGIENNEFVPYFQPYFSIAEGKPVGMEALARWQSDELGFVSPGRFVPLLEESGLIVQAGESLLRQVCQHLRTWLDQGVPVVPAAVNLSAVQFRQKNLAERIIEIVENAGLPRRYLSLEVTETSFMDNVETAARTMELLREAGFSMAVDDFGTGYSSLSYIKRFPIDALKIDISFVRGITESEDDEAMVRSIIAMARALKMKSIAEGVESGEQLSLLAEAGCDIAQGFHFARPLKAEDLPDFLRQHSAAAPRA